MAGADQVFIFVSDFLFLFSCERYRENDYREDDFYDRLKLLSDNSW